jgi:parallel beta-helix repeat protein
MTASRQSFTASPAQRFRRGHRPFAGRAGGRARKTNFIPRLTALEARTLLAILVVDQGGAGMFTTIQAAVDAAVAGVDTIEIHPATYTEQVTIGKSLTMLGTATGVMIQAPPTLTPDFGEAPVVEIKDGATVNVNNLIIEGPAPLQDIGGGTQATIDGIYIVGGATANLTGVMVNNIRAEPLSGIQNGGRAILVGSTSQSQVGHAVITDCIITNYQKIGIQTGGNGTTLTVTGTTVTGVGPTDVNGQNGIFIRAGTTATITNNTISGNQFTGASSGGPNPITAVQAIGIATLGDSSSISGNTLTGNDVGIYNLSAGTTISGNTVHGNPDEGIVLDQGSATVSNNTIDGSNIGVAVVALVGNTADSQGTLLSNDIFNNGLVAVGFPGAGISVLAQAGATTAPLLTANFNRIVGNSVGLTNDTTTAADATLNWWGSNTGPDTTGSDTTSGTGTKNTSPWLVLSIAASLGTIGPGGTSGVTASVTTDSSGATHPTAPFFPSGIPIAFGATGGTIAPTSVPTASGTALSSFTATTAAAGTASATLDSQTVMTAITVEAISFPPPPPPPPTPAGVPISVSFAATGGAGGFTYTVSPTGGPLPPGLMLDPATGVVSGTPTTPGTYTFTITATDTSGASADTAATVVVDAAFAINPITPPQGVVGSSYSAQLSTTGGAAPVTFALSGGTTLPPGLALSSAGLISGTPTSAGTFAFTVTATDSLGVTASLPLSIVVTTASQGAAPTVQNLQRFGFHAQPTTFVLTFSTPLDPTSAQNVANYRLNAVSGQTVGRAIRIRAAIYDPTTNTVTLEPASRVYLFGHYQLVVNGSTPTGVAGATGLLLDGRGNGVPGSDYLATFGKEILAGPNKPLRIARRSLHHQNLRTTAHASSHAPTGSTATSRKQALSAAPVDAVLAELVRREWHLM